MYSENMALPATFTAVRRTAAAPAVQQLINISYPSGHSSKPTAAMYSGRMGQTDGHLTVSYTRLRILRRQRQ